MPIYAGVLNGNNNNNDYQFQAGISAVLNQGVISGLAVTSGQVGTGSALVSVTRGSFTFLLAVHNTSAVSITTTGTTKVWLAIDQAKIDDNSAGAADGTGVASIQTGASYPWSGSFIKLASITSGTITDEREMLTWKNIFRKGFTAGYILDIVNGDEVQKLLSSSSVINNTDLVRFKDASGEWKEILWSVIKNVLNSAWKFIQTTVMWEALASPWYWSNITNTFSTSGSNSGTFANMWGRVQFAQRTKIISAKYPHNASNGSAAILITDVDGTTLGTYAVANGTKEATGINFVCEPWVIYQICCNSTANFSGLNANYTLTQADIDKGFISGCYANANFDATWRMQEVVIQTETPSMIPVSVVWQITYTNTFTANSAWASHVRLWNRFNFPYEVKLRNFKTWQTTASSSAAILILDSSGNTLKTVSMTTGTQVADLDFTCSANTEYRVVINDTANWTSWSTFPYQATAGYQATMPYALWGVYGAGSWTFDNASCLVFTECNVDFQGRAFRSRADRPAEKWFAAFAGFASWPKAVLDPVELNWNDYSYIDWFSGLTKWDILYVSNIAGALSTTKWNVKNPIWQAVSSSGIVLKKTPNSVDNVISYSLPNAGIWVTNYGAIGWHYGGLCSYTIATSTGYIGASMTLQWSWDGVSNWKNIATASGNQTLQGSCSLPTWFIRGMQTSQNSSNASSITVTN